MNQAKEIYNLKNDSRRIKMVQEASSDKKSYAGYRIENGLLFGTKDWFTAIEQGIIAKHIVKGVITSVYISGHNDYPEFEIRSDEGETSIWTREGTESAYEVGTRVELSYVEQKYKRPSDITGPISQCVIQIKIGEI